MRQIYSPVNAEIFMKISLLIVTNVNLAVPCDEILDGVICFICFKVNVLSVEPGTEFSDIDGKKIVG